MGVSFAASRMTVKQVKPAVTPLEPELARVSTAPSVLVGMDSRSPYAQTQVTAERAIKNAVTLWESELDSVLVKVNAPLAEQMKTEMMEKVEMEEITSAAHRRADQGAGGAHAKAASVNKTPSAAMWSGMRLA